MKQTLWIAFLVLCGISSCKKPMYGKEWMNGPTEEKLAPGIFYIRDNFVEKEFIKYEIDPRAITLKDILPFLKSLKDNIEKKNLDWIIRNTTFRGDLSLKLKDYRDGEDVMDVWVDEYKKNGRDIYCDFDQLFEAPMTKMEIKMKHLYKPDFTDDDVSYILVYNVKIYLPTRDYPHRLNLSLSSSYLGKFPNNPYNVIKEFVHHCPEPNFEPYSTNPNEKD